MAFDVKAALARVLQEEQSEIQTRPTANPAKLANPSPRLAELAKLAGGQVSNPHPSATVDDLMGRFREQVALMEYEDGLPRMRAVWLAALGIFVLPDERDDWFNEAGDLLHRFTQITLAIDAGLVVTFTADGNVSVGAYAPTPAHDTFAVKTQHTRGSEQGTDPFF